MFQLGAFPGKLGMGRAAGYRLGTAQFVTKIDPDDYFTPGSLQTCVQALRDDPSLALVSMGERIDTMDGDTVAHRRFMPTARHGMIVYRRSAIADGIDQVSDFNHAADLCICAAAKRAGEQRHIEQIGMVVRVHDRNYHYSAEYSESELAMIAGFFK